MGDFDRTFGAGANIDSIIDRFSDEQNIQDFDTEFDTKEIEFSIYQEALEFAKESPGNVVTRGAATRFGGGDGFFVRPSKKGEHLRFTRAIAKRYSCTAIPEDFTLLIPMDTSVDDCFFIPGCANLKSDDGDFTRDSVRNYLLSRFCAMTSNKLRRRPPEVEQIKSILSDADLALVPIADNICLIVRSWGGGEPSVEAALITEDGFTTLFEGGSSEELYDMLDYRRVEFFRVVLQGNDGAVLTELFDKSLAHLSELMTTHSSFLNGDYESRVNKLNRIVEGHTNRDRLARYKDRVEICDQVEWHQEFTRYLTSDDYRGESQHKHRILISVVAAVKDKSGSVVRRDYGDEYIFAGKLKSFEGTQSHREYYIEWEMLSGECCRRESRQATSEEVGKYISEFPYILVRFIFQS